MVNNPQVKCFVFSRTLLSHAACRGMQKLLSGRESSVFRQRIRRVLLAFSWCCDGKCGALCCSCHRSLRLGLQSIFPRRTLNMRSCGCSATWCSVTFRTSATLHNKICCTTVTLYNRAVVKARLNIADQAAIKHAVPVTSLSSNLLLPVSLTKHNANHPSERPPNQSPHFVAPPPRLHF